MARYKIVKVGFENENDIVNVVLLSKAERKKLGVEENAPVYVKRGKKKEIAMVCKQFREFLGKSGIASLNTNLAKKLGAKVGAIIEIDPGVTESDWAAYEQTIRIPEHQLIQGILRRAQGEA